MAGMQHPNIVRLLHYSTEKQKALIYEFLPGGDVDTALLKSEWLRMSLSVSG